MRRVLSVTAAAVLAGGLLSAPAVAGPTSGADVTDRVPTPTIAWGACAEGVDPAFECADVELPTDYDRARGGTTTVALTRLPATDPEQRLGSVFFNFGGPGGPGVATLPLVSDQVVSPQVRARYDLVGFDPRGVGESDPALCYASAEEEAAAVAALVPFPVGEAETRTYLQQTRDYARSCRTQARDVIEHASTANVARDLDVLRRAVGDERLNYVGYSYGTYLGATYARLFPDRVGRFVLDGTIDPVAYAGTRSDDRSLGARTGQGPAAAETFDEFLRLCAEAGEGCSLNALGDPREVVEQLWADLKEEPVTLQVQGQSIEVTYAIAITESFFAMYDHRGWSAHADFLALLAGAPVPQARQRALTLQQDAEETPPYASVGGSLASLCVDTEPLRPASRHADVAAAEEARAGGFGAFRAWVGLQCTYLGLRDKDAFTGPWEQTTDATVMVVGTRFDPATPYANTAPYADRFPDGRLVTVEGYGHTIIGRSSCADDLVTAYLLDGQAPADGTTCAQDTAPFAPVPAARGIQPLSPAPGAPGLG